MGSTNSSGRRTSSAIRTLAAIAALAVTSAAASPARAEEQPAPAAEPVKASVSVNASLPSGDLKSFTLPVVLGALGAAQIITGIVLFAAAPSTPANCNEDTKTCVRQPGQSDSSLRDDQDQAGRAHQMPTLGAIAITSGAIFAATGLAMYFYYRPSSGRESDRASAAPALVPYAAPGGGGLTALVRF